MLTSVLKVACFLKTYNILIILSISLSTVVSYGDEDFFPFIDENLLEKGDTRSDIVTEGSTDVTDTVTKDTQPEETDDDTTIDLINHEVDYKVLKKICPHFKHGKVVDMDTISDVWQVAYYKLKQDVSCFKIYIKKVSDEEKKANKLKYGTFADRVNWSSCDLEIQGNAKSESMRKHYLQSGRQGIMKNVIIVEHTVPLKPQEQQQDMGGKINYTYTFHPENPDQWLVLKNLLLMRDCYDGDVMVFSRVPLQPRRKEIRDALVTFGEYTMEGKMACK